MVEITNLITLVARNAFGGARTLARRMITRFAMDATLALGAYAIVQCNAMIVVLFVIVFKVVYL